MPVSLTFLHTLNVSIQPGDTIYYSVLDTTNGPQSGVNLQSSLMTKPIKYGVVMSVNHDTRTVVVNNTVGVTNPHHMGANVHVFFSKDRRVNHSGIIGYFMETKYKNDSTMPAEIFATAVDYVESSK